jgi:hypothetical protein
MTPPVGPGPDRSASSGAVGQPAAQNLTRSVRIRGGDAEDPPDVDDAVFRVVLRVGDGATFDREPGSISPRQTLIRAS